MVLLFTTFPPSDVIKVANLYYEIDTRTEALLSISENIGKTFMTK